MGVGDLLVVIKFGGLPCIRGFKFGGLEQYCHTYMHTVEILADFNLPVLPKTAKPPNLIPHQIFWLYGMMDSRCSRR